MTLAMSLNMTRKINQATGTGKHTDNMMMPTMMFRIRKITIDNDDATDNSEQQWH